MGKFSKFAKDYLAPEDPMDWIITILIIVVTVGGIGLIVMMMSSGYL